MTEVPIPVAGGAPPMSPAQAESIGILTTRMAGFSPNQDRQRLALADAVHSEIASGGTGEIALGKSPERARADEIATAMQPAPEMQPGQHDPEIYTRMNGHVFGDAAERQAFGEAAARAGFDPRLVHSTLQGIAGDPAIERAIAGGDAAIDDHLRGVRKFFEGLPGGTEKLRLGVAYLESVMGGNPALEATFGVAIMSADAISMAAYHAKQAGFTPPARR